MSTKRFDLFISYTHKQRHLVESVVGKLRRNQVGVWFDAWELQPGDFLRERISSGIEQSRGMLVVMSPDALDSNWVKYELNTGFTSEIERRGVRVIAALAPEMTPELLPIDLRAKVYLDLRTADSVDRSIYELTRLFNPYHYRHMEEAAKLKDEIQSRSMTVAELRDYLYGEYLGNLSREVELAVVRRLEKSEEPGAVLVLAERAMSYSRIGVIYRTLNALARRVDDGGMLAISATYTFDYRFRLAKLDLIRKSLAKQRAVIDLTPYEYVRDRSAAQELQLFLSTPSDDVRYGAVLNLMYDRRKDSNGKALRLPAKPVREEATAYAAIRLPGLLDLLRVHAKHGYDIRSLGDY